MLLFIDLLVNNKKKISLIKLFIYIKKYLIHPHSKKDKQIHQECKKDINYGIIILFVLNLIKLADYFNGGWFNADPENCSVQGNGGSEKKNNYR